MPWHLRDNSAFDDQTRIPIGAPSLLPKHVDFFGWIMAKIMCNLQIINKKVILNEIK